MRTLNRPSPPPPLRRPPPDEEWQAQMTRLLLLGRNRTPVTLTPVPPTLAPPAVDTKVRYTHLISVGHKQSKFRGARRGKSYKNFHRCHAFRQSYANHLPSTQFLTLFSGTVFHALSHGVIRFAWSVKPKNHFLTGGDSLTANQKLLLSFQS